jgi:hypothetical protein
MMFEFWVSVIELGIIILVFYTLLHKHLKFMKFSKQNNLVPTMDKLYRVPIYIWDFFIWQYLL